MKTALLVLAALAAVTFAAPAAASAEETCTPFVGDMDFQSRYCVATDPFCPVYRETNTGRVTCYPLG